MSLYDLVPTENFFYRQLSSQLDLRFLYAATKDHYGHEVQESIDAVVFFKILRVGYLNNINSDRKLVAFCSDSLAVRLFLKCGIDEALPSHSTISRASQLYGEELSLSLLQQILCCCRQSP